MGITELIFIFIFILIGLINVIARIIAARAREKKRSAAVHEKPPAPPEREEVSSIDLSEVRDKEKKILQAEEERIRGYTKLLEREPGLKEIAVQPEMHRGPVETVQPIEVSKPEEYIPIKTLEGEIVSLAETVKEESISRVESQTLPTLQVEITDRLLTEVGYGEYGKIDQMERKGISGWEKINRLPALKRAIILSEILGRPKGLE